MQTLAYVSGVPVKRLAEHSLAECEDQLFRALTEGLISWSSTA